VGDAGDGTVLTSCCLSCHVSYASWSYCNVSAKPAWVPHHLASIPTSVPVVQHMACQHKGADTRCSCLHMSGGVPTHPGHVPGHTPHSAQVGEGAGLLLLSYNNPYASSLTSGNVWAHQQLLIHGIVRLTESPCSSVTGGFTAWWLYVPGSNAPPFDGYITAPP
jgi:hypothetical protein